jgi:hypothetical protein
MDSKSYRSIKSRSSRSSQVLNLIKSKSSEINKKSDRLFSIFGSIWKSIFLVVLVIILLLIAYLIFTSDYFKVTNVIILNSTTFVNQSEVSDYANSSYVGKNIFQVDGISVVDNFKSKFPVITNVKLDKKLPGTLLFYLIEQKYSFSLICTDVGAYLDESGNIQEIIQFASMIGINDIEIRLLNGDFLISEIELSEEEVDKMKKNDGANLDENIRKLKAKKYYARTLELYSRIFQNFNSQSVGKFDLLKVYSINCSTKNLDARNYSHSKRALLSYELLKSNELFKDMKILELRYNRFVVNLNEKFYIFSSIVPLEDQIRRYSIILKKLGEENVNYSIIDLTQEKVIVL